MLSILLLSLLTMGVFSSPTYLSPSSSSLDPRDATLKPYQLRGVQAPIFHLYLQSLPTSKSTPVMGPESSSEYFNLGSTIQSLNSSLYLNIGNKVDGKSYLPLSFGTASNTTAWALEGDTVITSTGSTYGRQLNFLACESATSGYYTIYLQTGSDTPSGVTCSNYQTIHTPCLC